MVAGNIPPDPCGPPFKAGIGPGGGKIEPHLELAVVGGAGAGGKDVE